MVIKRWKELSHGGMVSVPSRLYRAIPAVLLGILLNTLDAVSTGLLVFPSTERGSGFANLQVQAISLYIMSTIASQLTMTLGGSLFPGALGSMLIEILPFLRGIASSIQEKLGSDSPSLLPTVLAAYAMTSLLTGAVFTILGALRCGRLVEYFPRTVLIGTIGAIGLSLFLLALELPLPPSSAALNLASVRSVLFNNTHLPLLFASVLPALFLSISIRMQSLSRATRGFTEHALYIPVYVLAITGVFWAVVAGTGDANSAGMAHLASIGWLFTVEDSVRVRSGIGNSWNYWSLFNFSAVRWSAMTGAIQDIVLLVIIGVLNLPIYIPSMALVLDVPTYNMNHELLGHGASNILAGVLGTVPNLVVLSNSRFFTQAGGGRFEAMIVIALTVVLFFVCSLILPYIPTILASTLVLFLGIELMIEALWDTTKTLLWCEWAIVMGTLVACTFLGFAPGFGVGIALAMILHLGWSTLDSEARAYNLLETQKRYQLEPLEPNFFSRGSHLALNTRLPSQKLLFNEKEHAARGIGAGDKPSVLSASRPDVTIIKLTGYLFFAIIPSLEGKMKVVLNRTRRCSVVLDLTNVHRIETSVIQFLARKVREYSSLEPPVFLVIAGIVQNSGVHADLERGGVNCCWGVTDAKDAEENKVSIVTFEDLREAICCFNTPDKGQYVASESDILDAFCRLFSEESLNTLFSPFVNHEIEIATEMRNAGIRIRTPAVKEILAQRDKPLNTVFLVVRGRLLVEKGDAGTLDPVSRPSIKSAILAAPRQLFEASWLFLHRSELRHEDSCESAIPLLPSTSHSLLAGDSFGFLELASGQKGFDRVSVTAGPCWILEVDTSSKVGMAWAFQANALLQCHRKTEEIMLKICT